MSARAPRPAAAALLVALALTGFPVAASPGAALGARLDGVSSRGLPAGCLYDGRWFSAGASVPTGEACLQCACAGGALSCRRRACAALPDPPPRRCHVLHRRGSCCPELHCPDGVQVMEHGAFGRSEDEEEMTAPASPAHACVEGGTVYAAGSAMGAARACEQCFCLRGARRCVRPACLPPPAGCRARAAPGLCCPPRYYCEHPTNTTKPPHEKHPHDCKVDGKWISEGEKIAEGGAGADTCTACFCLRGAVRCQALACAPPLLGCTPRLRAGHCCAHHYHCADHDLGPPMSQFLSLTSNALTTARKDHDAYLSPSKKETTTKTTLASVYLFKNTRIMSATNNLVSTTKVKRKTSDPPLTETSSVSSQNTTAVVTARTTEEPTTTVTLPVTAQATTSTTSEASTELRSTEQPEGSVRIMINGTINCTAELSSTSLPLNFTSNDTDAEELDKITKESHSRTPIINVSTLEDHTFSPSDIITDRNVDGNFDESETFVINVTSSLRTNTSHPSTASPAISKPTPILTKVSIPTDIAEALNSSKKTKGDYDFDYTEPTLPPSLPNLKIIPFVAADAVLEEEHSKEAHAFPNEREDNFPVYYPAIDGKDRSFTRREDVYHSTQYPVFITDKGDEQYQSLSQDVDPTSAGYSNAHNDLGPSGSEYTVPTRASLEGRFDQKKAVVTPQPLPRTTFKLESPKVNMFSPPVETEGGFVPKGPSGLMVDEYYAVFPSTPPGSAVPHLTTSMPLDINKEGECVSSDGRRIPSGGTISVACSECSCIWGTLHCTPRACHAPPPRCRRRSASASSEDLCCGELICDEENKLTTTHENTTAKQKTTAVSYTTKPPDETSTSTTEAVTNSPIAHVTQATVGADGAATSTSSDDQGPIHQIQNASKTISVDKTKINTLINFTAATTESGDHFTKPILPSTTPALPSKEPELEESLEYEEEEEEGFSFGNVLKLLLSGDRYDTTTRPLTTSRPPPVKLATTTRALSTPPSAPPPKVAPFVPLPALPFLHAKLSQNPINRIDHLVLGEATAIKRTTIRPLASTPRPRPASSGTTQRLTEPSEVTRREEHRTSTESAWPPAGGGLAGLSGGLLKLAGCNIYGRMYRVGRIIAELSTPCQECWCTELGVHCNRLNC